MIARPVTLADWLVHIERVHPRTIAMGLGRVRAVKDAMHLEPSIPLIIVGGTNGKGSACMMLEAILHHGGYRTGCYTSPHLTRYNERVRIAKADADDASLVRAFAAVENARVSADVALTYFEFGTLAAMWLFIEQRVDALILEVGLGGRLDAVNVFEPDCALVMSVDIDHVEYLGDTHEKIGFEKAGIFRAGRPAICADADPPISLVEYASQIGARLMLVNRDYGHSAQVTQWRYWGPGGDRHGLPYPALRGAYQLGNAAACITALDMLREYLPVTMNDIRTGLLEAENPGRFQVLPGRPLTILDVAHNPHAARALAQALSSLPRGGRVIAVFAMLGDKDIDGVIRVMAPHIDEWRVAGIEGVRGTTAAHLSQRLRAGGVTRPVHECANVASALNEAYEIAAESDKILVFGSFHTVSEAMQALRARRIAV
jgi:dihydrofolate synthase/folylpolyglutamate synthase